MQEQTSERTEDPSERGSQSLTFHSPTAADGPLIWDLVAACPPLDRNSLYCNLLQATDFAETCIIAKRAARAVGWISAYRPPKDPDVLFIWQVAVRPQARGLGLAKAMIVALLGRSACEGVTRIRTTITPGNDPSWAFFRSVAELLSAPLAREPWFDAEAHFEGRHESEHLVTIGPIAVRDPPRGMAS